MDEMWEAVCVPADEDVIGLKWVFQKKYNLEGKVLKYKARIIAKGPENEDMFSSLSRRLQLLRIFLALSARLRWPIYQLDIKTGVLNGKMEEVVYTKQAEGFTAEGNENQVCQLNKALYGLKQSPRGWFTNLDSFLRRTGFQRSDNEPTLYIKKKGNKTVLLVSVYVDDVIYMGSSRSVVNQFKSSMKNEFGMEDLGIMHNFLGLEIKQGDDGVFVSQRKYARNLVKSFKMSNRNAASTPMGESEKLQAEDVTDKADAEKFKTLVGGLIPLTLTRPDISFSVDVVSRFMDNPTIQHFGAAERILSYIAGTQDFGIWYPYGGDFKLTGFGGSDDAGNSGFVFNLGSGAVSWGSMKTEADENMGAAASACQATRLRMLLSDMNQKQKEATEIFCDDSFSGILSSGEDRGRAKHKDIQFHFVRALIEDGQVAFKSCSNHDEIADIFTKALPQDEHVRLRAQLGVCTYASREC